MSEPFYPPDVVQVAPPESQVQPAPFEESDTDTSGTSAWNAPISVAYTEDSSQRFGFDEKEANPRYQRLATEALKTALGPMPVAAFLDAFLPNEHNVDDGMPHSEGTFRQVAQVIASTDRKKLKESHLYEPLVRALNDRDFCPGFTFWVTSNHRDESHGRVGSTKPDVICYAKKHATHSELTSANVRARADMGFAETFIEVKLADPFGDPPSGTSPSAWPFFLGHRKVTAGSGSHTEALEDLGQAIAYAIEILARQHRYFLFSVALCMTRARLIRWDRSGFIVTESFDIIEHPHYLCMFLWRLSRLPDPARGYDSTVELASRAEEDIFRSSIQAHLMKQITLDASPDAMKQYLNVHYKPNHVTAIRMPPVAHGSGVPTSRKLLISRPICIPLSLSGRCTRTYWAVNVEETDSSSAPRDVWLLKDTWRIFAPSVTQNSTGTDGGADDGREGSIMQSLTSKGVPNIPPVVSHWDVAVTTSGDIQSTITQRYLHAPWVSEGGNTPSYRLRRARVVHRVHYRLVLKIAGFDLLQISSTEELLHATHDAFTALLKAYRETRRLHRDVHPGNIILYRDSTDETTRSQPRTGYLIDWENSRVATRTTQPPVKSTIPDDEQWSYTVIPETSMESTIPDDYEPSLQWQFLSWKLAAKAKTSHSIMDDVESIVYVVIYCGMLRLRCKLADDRTTLAQTMHALFDSKKPFTDTEQGGDGKLDDILQLGLSKKIMWTSSALQNWVFGAYALRRSALNPSVPSDDHWNLASMTDYWTSFFAKNPELPRDDRALNVLSREVYFSRVAPRIALGTIFEPTAASQMKRTGSLVVHDTRPAKRARIDEIQDPAGASTGATYQFAAASIDEEPGPSTKKQRGNGKASAKPRAGWPRGGGRSRRGC